ncbi:cobyrinic acid a,c-diamide synthase [Natronorarus salvus]|uniref:cobyrinic acid a,c-diamide synthase n=1 Tax=Natronorarus salvus TaxID=3117733 RepID=UPI002F265C8A
MNASSGPPGIVLGGTASGVGKTVATLSVIRTLAREGYDVQPAKAGPDFIDTSHHESTSSYPSRTLDPWLQGEEGLRGNYARGEGDLCVVEGMMGLYDGSVASTADVAAALGLPVVLVVDASAGMQSVAATALGFREYAAHVGVDVDVAGVIASRAHGGRHAEGIREALPDSLAWFGRVPPDDRLEVPERHLGLHMGEEAPIDGDALDAAAACLDGEALAALARERGEPTSPVEGGCRDGERIDLTVAVASDAAFCFSYPATTERLRERAEVVTFSPVADDPLPDCDGVYLPGGYPELHGADLAGSRALASLADRAADGLPVLGECGGLMALSESLSTVDGESYPMAGVLPAEVHMHERYRALDHVELRAREDTLTAGAGDRLRGHEFHYSSAEVGGDVRFAFDVERGTGISEGRDGLVEYAALGTYAHVHPETGAFDRFLDAL